MRIYKNKKPCRRDIFHRILDLAGENCAYFVLVARGQLQGEGNDLLNSLQPYMAESKVTNRWPGTVGGTITLLKYFLNESSSWLLKEWVISPCKLLHPLWPEDLSFLKADGRPWYTCIAHERYAYFEIRTEAELTIVQDEFDESIVVFSHNVTDYRDDPY